jgi:hypothetical protein
MHVVLSLWYNLKADTLSTAKAHSNEPATPQSTLSQPIYLKSTLTSLSFLYPHLTNGFNLKTQIITALTYCYYLFREFGN